MTQDTSSKDPKTLRSAVVTAGPNRAAARSYLRAAGLGDEDFARPLIAVVNTWSSVTPCNMHLGDLAEHVRRGVREAGGVPIDFISRYSSKPQTPPSRPIPLCL